MIDLLTEHWPSVVSFGAPHEKYLLESAIPLAYRPAIMKRLQQAISKIQQATIESGQKHNAINALTSIINNLHTLPWDQAEHSKLCDFVAKMDQVKKIKLSDYDDFLSAVLTEQPVEIF